MSLYLLMLLIIFVSAVLVLCDKSLYYLPILTTLVCILFLAMKEFPAVYECIKAAAMAQQQRAAALQAAGVGPISDTLSNAYAKALNTANINDNRWITTASNVNPDDRVRIEKNMRDLNADVAPIQGTPTIDVASGRYLNIDRNIGGFKIEGADQYAKSLADQRAITNSSYYSDTAVQRDYMINNANDKVAFMNMMNRSVPKHTWFKL